MTLLRVSEEAGLLNRGFGVGLGLVVGGKSQAEDMKLNLTIPSLQHQTEVITFDVIGEKKKKNSYGSLSNVMVLNNAQVESVGFEVNLEVLRNLVEQP